MSIATLEKASVVVTGVSRRSFIKRTAATALLCILAINAFSDEGNPTSASDTRKIYSLYLNGHSHPLTQAFTIDGGNNPSACVILGTDVIGRYTLGIAAKFDHKEEIVGPPAGGYPKKKNLSYSANASISDWKLVISKRAAHGGQLEYRAAANPPATLIPDNWKAASVTWTLDDQYDSTATIVKAPQSGTESRTIGGNPISITLKDDINGLIEQDFGALSGNLSWTFTVTATDAAVIQFVLGVSGTLTYSHFRLDGDRYVVNDSNGEPIVDSEEQPINFTSTFSFTYPVEVKEVK